MGTNVDDIIKFFLDVLQSNYLNLFHFEYPHLKTKNLDHINIFDTPFDKKAGFQVYGTEKIRLLLLRFDKIHKWEEIVRSNTPYTNFEIISENLTSNKEMYAMYQTFNFTIKFPEILTEVLENDKMLLEYFYEEHEIKDLKERWQEKNRKCLLNL